MLLHESKHGWKPVAYASRSMNETKQRYAQIEKEALAITWAYNKFSDYILGRKFLIETDHKPLIPLLNAKHMDTLPPRILRFRLRLAKYNYTVSTYQASYCMLLTLCPELRCLRRKKIHLKSRHSWKVSPSSPCQQARNAWMTTGMLKRRTRSAPMQVREYCTKQWPPKKLVSAPILPYWNEKDNLSVCNDLLMFGNCIVVPKSLQN